MANYNGSSPFKLPRQLRIKNGVNVETLAGSKTLDKSSSMIQILDPDGAQRDINLPAVQNGMVFIITNRNGGAHDLKVIKPDAGYFLVSDGMGFVVACDGNNWYQVINA